MPSCGSRSVSGMASNFARQASVSASRLRKVAAERSSRRLSSDRTSAKRDWYNWRNPAPGGGPPTNWLSQFGGSAWEYDQATGQYYYHAFLSAHPDLRHESSPFLKGILGFNLATSAMYATAAFGQFGPDARDTLGIAVSYDDGKGMPEPVVGALILGVLGTILTATQVPEGGRRVIFGLIVILVTAGYVRISGERQQG